MARVMIVGSAFRTSSTSLLFCIGLSRQHRHERLARPSLKMAARHSSLSRANLTDIPSSTSPPSATPSRPLCAAWSFSVQTFKLSASVTYTSFVDSPKRLEDRAMSTAVSVLSPVNTHTRILASLRLWRVSGTPSCNLSSTAVTPTRVRLVSIMASTLATSSSFLESRLLCATLSFAAHSWYSLSSIFLLATRRVRRPWCENLLKCSSVSRETFSVSKFKMTLSAPLVMTCTSGPCLTMTDMRFRSELNSISLRIWNFRGGCPGGPIIKTSLAEAPGTRTRSLKTMPTLWAA
mmetsp:Transcript_10683/g.29683  ORF Transcript_10683/g.29683 Transcript_10683/m.29683 type:complete len:292 (-) Transcript_10683:1826-2701(-)